MALWPFEMNTMPGLLRVWKPQTFREKLLSVFGHKDSLQKASLTLLHPLHPDRKYNIQHTSAEINQSETASSKEVGERGS